MSSISAVILAKNEKENLASCIKHLKFCNEIIVINDNSTDQTVKIAKTFGAKVYTHPLNHNFAAQRNFALDKVRSKWTFFVDADEIVSGGLQKEISKVIKNKTYSGYVILRIDSWLGKILSHGEHQICLLRLAQTKSGYWVRSVHEHWLITGRVGKLKNPLIHHPHPKISQFISKVNFYADLHAEENKREGKTATFFHVILFPPGKFFVYYILKGGFLDGVHGFVASIIMSFHSFLSWSKLWQNQKR